MRVRRVLDVLLAACVLLVMPAWSQQRVEIASEDAGVALRLVGHWFNTSQPGRRPAVLMLHGCGGAYDRHGELSKRMRDYARLLNAQGWHALALDSLTPRGERELCTQVLGTRRVTMKERRADTLSALQWLARRDDVDADRLVLLGWSNGGSAVLASTDAGLAAVSGATVRPRAAVAFYPGCEAGLKSGYKPVAPLLLLVGGSDDWTPADPCRRLAENAGAPVELEVFEGAYHGFDGAPPVRLRQDVPNGVHPGRGVHVGGDPGATEASRRHMLAFLREQLK